MITQRKYENSQLEMLLFNGGNTKLQEATGLFCGLILHSSRGATLANDICKRYWVFEQELSHHDHKCFRGLAQVKQHGKHKEKHV